MDADLVGAAGFEIERDEAVIWVLFEDTVVCYGA